MGFKQSTLIARWTSFSLTFARQGFWSLSHAGTHKQKMLLLPLTSIQQKQEILQGENISWPFTSMIAATDTYAVHHQRMEYCQCKLQHQLGHLGVQLPPSPTPTFQKDLVGPLGECSLIYYFQLTPPG